MARDYKHRKRRKKAGGTSPGFVTGLVCGLAVAVLVHLYHAGQGAAGDAPALAARPSPARAEPPPATPEEDRFEFYDILPGLEVVVPEPPPAAAGSAASAPRTLPPGSYYLQAGAFRKHAEADRRKASLALLGVTSTIQQVTIDGDQTWFRVIVGPMREAGELDAMRSRLTAADIETFPMRAVAGR
jgi:cell division protein FtsN